MDQLSLGRRTAHRVDRIINALEKIATELERLNDTLEADDD